MRIYTRTEGEVGQNSTVVLTGHAFYDPIADTAFKSTVVTTLTEAELGVAGVGLMAASTEGEAKPIWTYVSGAMRLLGPDTVMSTERRAELGRIMVHCLDCGAHLTHPISVARGIGPVCSGLGYSE